MKGAGQRVPPVTSAWAPDLEAVAAFLRAMIASRDFAGLIAAILGLLARIRDVNTELMRRLAQHGRKKPPSERTSILQREFAFMREAPANDGPPAAPSAGDDEKKAPKKRGPSPGKKHRHGRAKLPESLERVEDRLRVPEELRACGRCGEGLTALTWKPCEKLDVRPMQYIVRRTLREVLSCPCCRSFVRTAERADEVLDRGALGTDLLVEALVDHYHNAVPWERMGREAQAQGVPLAPNTLASSVGRVVDLLDPVVRYITEAALRSDYVSLDATSMRILDAEHPLGIRTGSLWGIVGAHRYATFFCAPSGHAAHLEKRIEGFRFALAMCDGAPTLNVVEKPGTVRGGCWAHARRKLVAALRGGDERAMEPLAIIGRIFHVDAEARRRGDGIEARLLVRKSESVRYLEDLRKWCDERRGAIEPKSPLGTAVTYLTRQWERLSRFIEHASMELTNNETESDLRRHVLNRRTWFFVGHDESARRAADALTVLTTCRKMGIEPRAYLRDTLARLLAGEKDLAVILPESFAARVAAARAAKNATDATDQARRPQAA